MKASLSPHSLSFGYIVGMTRFELATSGPPDRCATGLRHIPPLKSKVAFDLVSLPYSFTM